MFDTHIIIHSGGLSAVGPTWNITGDVLNEKLLRLYIPLTGEACIRLGNQRVTMTAGNVYLFSGNTVNDQFYNKTFEHLWLHISPASLRLRYCLIWKFAIQQWPAPRVPHTDELISGMRKLIIKREKFIADHPEKPATWPVFFADEAYWFRLQSYLSHLIGDVLDTQNLMASASEWAALETLSPAIAFMDSNYLHNPPLETIARQVCLTPWHFHKLFVQTFGQSPHRYMLLKRLLKGRELLLNSSLTIKEIARQAGYDNNFYFSKVFKDEFHVSPKKFRQMEAQYPPSLASPISNPMGFRTAKT